MATDPAEHPERPLGSSASLPRHQPGEPPASLRDVPVFNCIVHLATDAPGQVRGQVANLAGIACTGANERDVLRQIVAAFKQRVSTLSESGVPIPWIAEPLPPEPGAQTRYIPVHL